MTDIDFALRQHRVPAQCLGHLGKTMRAGVIHHQRAHARKPQLAVRLKVVIPRPALQRDGVLQLPGVRVVATQGRGRHHPQVVVQVYKALDVHLPPWVELRDNPLHLSGNRIVHRQMSYIVQEDAPVAALQQLLAVAVRGISRHIKKIILVGIAAKPVDGRNP